MVPMKARLKLAVSFSMLLALMGVCGGAARAQGTGTLQADLEKQYKLTKMGSDSTGDVVVSAGQVLVLSKGGVLGVPYNNMVFCPSHYQDGTLKAPNTMCKLSVQKVSKYINSGEKVYVTKIEIQPKDEKVIFSIVECDTCNNAQTASQMKSQIVFHYPKGYLEGGADAGQVGDVIGQVLTADAGGDQAAAGGTQDAGAAQQQAAPAAAAAPAAPAAPPASVQMGMTPDQVVGILGQPDKIVNLGAKQLYIYKDLKVTFLNGKVTDAQ
jgi:hypothetical protein